MNLNYTVVSFNLMIDKELSNNSKVLYTVLKGLAEDLNHIKVSEKELSRLMDCTDRTVRNGLSELEAYGLVAKYREQIKDVQTYVVIPYEIREVVQLDTVEDFEKLLDKVRIFVETEIDGKKSGKLEDSVIQDSQEKDEVIRGINKKLESGEELNTYDYGAYFYKLNKEKNGMITNFRNPRALQIMKRVTNGKSQEENLKLIGVFIEVYDSKFKRKGFECPTIEGFGTSWIYNIVVDCAKRYVEDNRELDLANEVF